MDIVIYTCVFRVTVEFEEMPLKVTIKIQHLIS